MDIGFPHAGEIYSTLCAMLWAIGIILFKKSGEKLSPIPLNLFKNTVGLLLFVPTLALLGVRFFPPERTAVDWITLLASGAIGIGIADSVFFASLNRLGAGRSAIVDCLYSPFIILCSFLYLDEEMGLPLLLALVLMTVGIFVGTWRPEKTEHPGEQKRLRQGVLLGVISMFLMAVGIVAAKPVLDRSDPWWATTVRLVGGLLFLSLQGLAPHRRAEMLRCFRPAPLWKVTVPAGIIGAYLAMFFWVAGMKYTDTTTASVLNQMSVLFVLVIATVVLKEPLTPRKAVAVVLGFTGGVVVTL